MAADQSDSTQSSSNTNNAQSGHSANNTNNTNQPASQKHHGTSNQQPRNRWRERYPSPETPAATAWGHTIPPSTANKYPRAAAPKDSTVQNNAHGSAPASGSEQNNQQKDHPQVSNQPQDVSRSRSRRNLNEPLRAQDYLRERDSIDRPQLQPMTPKTEGQTYPHDQLPTDDEVVQEKRIPRRTPDQGSGEMPSWYQNSYRSYGNPGASPRATIDGSFNEPRWRSTGKQALHFSKKRSKRNYIIIAIIIVVILAIIFALTQCASNGQADDQTNEPLTTSDLPAPEAQTITLSFAGDCTLGTDANFDPSTSFNAVYDDAGDPAYFFKNVVDIFSQDDATIVNMEGTLTESTDRQDKTFAFKGDADYAQILVQGDVQAASLANNHSHDYGDSSYTDTINTLEAAGIPTFGYDRIAYLDVKGIKVALIGTYELAEGIGIKDEMLNNIKKAQEEQAQLIVVYPHWGTERDTVPDDVQMELAHAAIDAGAHLVIGSHPHVIQGYEKYNGRYIVYSLGNFCFGGNKNPSDKDCMIFQQTFTVSGNNVDQNDEITVIPCSISSSAGSNNYQPSPAEGSEKTRIENKIQESNDAIAAKSA